MSMSSAVEPLRMANRISGQDFYSWRTIGETGEDVVASDGLSVNAEYSIKDPDVLSNLDIVIVCGGRRIQDNITDPIIRWLRSVSRCRIARGAICTGSRVLAEAGLLDGYRCSVHWENISSVTDLFPKVSVGHSVFTIDRNRLTCSGGIAPVDMMLHLVRRQLGEEVSAAVAEQFVYERVRGSSDLQRMPFKHMDDNKPGKFIIAVELMEANIMEPISQPELASQVGLSSRQLQRLFQRNVGCTPTQQYLKIRLQRARELLHQTTMTLVEVSTLTGFASNSHFSKCYKSLYGFSPSIERQRRRSAR